MSNTRDMRVDGCEKLRKPLAAIERQEDPATVEYLVTLGVAPGWHCLEDDFFALFDDPAFAWREGLRIATWGRRPTPDDGR